MWNKFLKRTIFYGPAVAAALHVKDKVEERAREEGRTEAKAEYSLQLEKITNRLDQALAQLKANNEYFNAIIALEAVAVSCAACDGDFSEEEKVEIGEFIKGMMEQQLPSTVKDKISDIYNNPPTISEAFELARNSGVSLEIFSEIIEFVVRVDNVIKPEEKAFMHAWQKLCAA